MALSISIIAPWSNRQAPIEIERYITVSEVSNAAIESYLRIAVT